MTGTKPKVAAVKPPTKSDPEKAVSPSVDGVDKKSDTSVAKRPNNVALLKELLNPPVTDLKSKMQKKARFHLRHMVMIGTFILCVLLPSLAATTYMLFIAQDQYHSSASFSVRSIQTSSVSDVLGMFSQSSSGSTVSDSYILLDYIRGEQMLRMVDKEFDLDKIYGVRGFDYYYALSPDSPIEDKLNYWRNIIQVNYDHTSGIIDLDVRAFDPAQAEKIGKFIITASEKMVNDLSAKARSSVLEAAHEEVYLAERRLSTARYALLEYRDREQEVDPIEGAKIAAQLISSLELQLVQLNSDYAMSRSQMSDDSPRVRLLKNKIDSLEQQIALERSRLGSGTTSSKKAGRVTEDGAVANRIAEYEILETNREFAERAYTAALGSLEKARLDANSRQRYLAVFLQPTTSESAQYPNRIFNSFLVMMILLLFWSFVVMGYYNIRDRN